jgi:FkbM family methyltransferase
MRKGWALQLLLLLLGALTDAHDEGGCVGFSTDMDEYRTLVSHHPWSGRAWQGLTSAFLDAGCSEDALLAADLVARFYSACACDGGARDTAELVAASSQSLVEIQARFLEERGGAAAYFADGQSATDGRRSRTRCCGAKVDLEMGGSRIVLLGGSFEDEVMQAAWQEAHHTCPRYFAQCQQTSPFAVAQQDMLLHMHFGDKVGGVYVDVGSVDGFSFSNTYFFERNLNWTGICVEPNEASLEVLKRVRARAHVYNVCVSNITSSEDFLQCTGYTRMLSGLLSTMNPEHHARIARETLQHGGSRRVVKVQVLLLADILAAHSISHVDLLSIDTEGAELEVLLGIEWENVTISVIILEMLDPTSPDSTQIDEYLRMRGYRRSGYVCQDAVFLHSSFVPVVPRKVTCIQD